MWKIGITFFFRNSKTVPFTIMRPCCKIHNSFSEIYLFHNICSINTVAYGSRFCNKFAPPKCRTLYGTRCAFSFAMTFSAHAVLDAVTLLVTAMQKRYM